MYVNISYGRGFRGILEYSLASKEEPDSHQIGGNVRGSLEQIQQQFYAAAGRNPRVQKPVAHIIVAWHPDDQPDDATMVAVGDRLLGSLHAESDEYQHIMVRHDDEPHPHMHLVLNRVGIDGSVMANKQKPYLRLRAEADRLEAEYDFTPAVPLAERVARPGRLLHDQDNPPSGAPAQAAIHRPTPLAADEPTAFFRVGRTLPIEPHESRSLDAPADLAALSAEAVRPVLGGRQELKLNRMEERSGMRSSKHQVYTGVLAALAQCDGSWGSLDLECRAQGIAPSWCFDRSGTFSGASFTLLSATRPGEAEVGPHGGTFTFKGSQLGPNGGLSKRAIQHIMDNKIRQSSARQFRGERTAGERRSALLPLTRQLRAGTSGGRHHIGAHLGRQLRWATRFQSPMNHRSVQSFLALIDDRRQRRAILAPHIRPLIKPRR